MARGKGHIARRKALRGALNKRKGLDKQLPDLQGDEFVPGGLRKPGWEPDPPGTRKPVVRRTPGRK